MTSDELLDVIVELINEKKDQKIHPEHVTLHELSGIFGLENIKRLIDRLVSSKSLCVGDTCNSKYYKPQ